MADPTYDPKVYRKQGGNETVVASGGKITVESGGEIDLQAGSKISGSIETKTASFTVLPSESGKTFILAAVDLKATLPPTAAGLRYTFIVKTVSASTGAQLSPVAADAIHRTTSVDDKDLINTPATDVEGDSVTIVGDGVDGWWIESLFGIWAKES